MISLHRHLPTILVITVATNPSHGSASRGWIRPSPNVFFAKPPQHAFAPLLSLRGGSSTHQNAAVATDEDDDDEEEEELQRRQRREEHEKLAKYRMEQQLLYQLRSTFLAEALASRGVPLPTIASVATADGERPPDVVDWDCALSTADEPRSCLYSFDAAPGTKVVAPLGTDQWISLAALNRLRRVDRAKVEPMWHSQFSILRSWFSDASEFSLMQHVGLRGFVVSAVLLDGANGMVLRSLLVLSVVAALVLVMPVLEYIVGRLIVSAPFWGQWLRWGRIVRAGLPLKLLIGQLVWKGVACCFTKIEHEVREYIVNLECEILEDSVPVTVGVGREEETMEDELEDDEMVTESGEDFDDYDDDGY